MKYSLQTGLNMGLIIKKKEMEYKVTIPEEFFTVFKFIQNKHKGVAAINTALRGFEPRAVFGWHLSIMIHFNAEKNDGMPSKVEHEKIEHFEEKVGNLINENANKPNGLFLGRITWNNSAELIWRVHNADEANKTVQHIVSKQLSPFYFDYRIDPDENWALTEWHLKTREYNLNEN